MLEATFNFPGHDPERRTIEAMPKIGEAIDGPGGVVWAVKSIFRNSVAGIVDIAAEPAETAPAIVGDIQATLLL